MDQKGITLGGFGCFADEVGGGDTNAALTEELAVGSGDFRDGGFVEVDPVSPPQERGNALIKEVGYGCWQASKDQPMGSPSRMKCCASAAS